ncbi:MULTISPECIES: IS3 family transposase [Sphingobacterium]|uniref:IS3 family transposase n=1 Tax=Sphingobacterium TaxID=28453 RepID=UPI00309ABE65
MNSNQRIYPIEKMCKVMGVGSRSYYAWKIGSKQPNDSKVEILENRIKIIYFKNKQRYGSPRIAAELLDDGVKISRITVAKYMRNMGLRSKIGKKFKVTTDSKHSHKIMDNVLNREFTASEPSKVWVSDITYIHTKEGFLYLTTILDLYDRKCIGWSISDTMSTQETSLAAWKMAIKNRKLSAGLIFHSDRGTQYACEKFSKILDSYKIITRSMSRKGNCWDNAVAESFFKTLKSEQIYGNKLVSKEQMKTDLFEYIEIWYNRERRHSKLGNLTIEQFNSRKQNLKKTA